MQYDLHNLIIFKSNYKNEFFQAFYGFTVGMSNFGCTSKQRCRSAVNISVYKFIMSVV